MLAAEIWHWWIGVVLFIAAIAAAAALIGGYLKSVSSKKYPPERTSRPRESDL